MAIYLGDLELSTGGGGGAGGITKFKKYSTLRSLNDTDVRTTDNPTGGITILTQAQYNSSATVINVTLNVAVPADALVGQRMWIGNYYNTAIVAQTATTGANQTSQITMSQASGGWNAGLYFNPPSSTGQVGYYINASTITVNPATDLLLADGATVGVLLVGGGTIGGGSTSASDSGYGGYGGRLLYKVTTITTAATDLVLQIGAGDVNTSQPSPSADSTITGGLSLTTVNGNNISGFPANHVYYSGAGAISGGIGNYGGYGIGGGIAQTGPYSGGAGQHGWGAGGEQTSTTGGDGAIILYY